MILSGSRGGAGATSGSGIGLAAGLSDMGAIAKGDTPDAARGILAKGAMGTRTVSPGARDAVNSIACRPTTRSLATEGRAKNRGGGGAAFMDTEALNVGRAADGEDAAEESTACEGRDVSTASSAIPVAVAASSAGRQPMKLAEISATQIHHTTVVHRHWNWSRFIARIFITPRIATLGRRAPQRGDTREVREIQPERFFPRQTRRTPASQGNLFPNCRICATAPAPHSTSRPVAK